MAPATTVHLLRYGASMEGERIPTLAGRAAFTVRALPNGLEIVPESTGKRRLVSAEMLERVLEATADRAL